jgi:hypothetical protein
MSTGKLISNLGIPDTSDSDFGKFVTGGIFRDNNQINNALFSPSGPERGVLILALSLNSGPISITGNKNLANEYFLILNGLPRRYDPIGVKFINRLIINLALLTIRFTNLRQTSIIRSDILF